MAVSTSTSNAANLHLYYEKKLLSTLEPRLVLHQLGKKQSMPKGLGKQVKWLRYASIASSQTELTEGVAPSEISFTTANVTADIKQYGQFSKISDVLVDTAIDRVLENVAERMGRAAAKTIESLIVSQIDANAPIQRANNYIDDSAVGAGDVVNHKELIEAMIRQKAEFIGPHESGDYVAVLHPLVEFDLKSDSQAGSWLDISKYDAAEKLMRGEFGKMYGMRLLVSDLMTKQNSGTDDPNEAGSFLANRNIYSSYVIGEEAFGVVELNGDSVKMLVKKAGSGGTSDPLEQFSTVGYKIHGFAAKYLDASSKRVIRIKSATALG